MGTRSLIWLPLPLPPAELPGSIIMTSCLLDSEAALQTPKNVPSMLVTMYPFLTMFAEMSGCLLLSHRVICIVPIKVSPWKNLIFSLKFRDRIFGDDLRIIFRTTNLFSEYFSLWNVYAFPLNYLSSGYLYFLL